MKFRVKVKIDLPLLRSLNDFINDDEPSAEAIKEIKHLCKKLLKNIQKKTESLDVEIPEIKNLSDI